MDKHAEARSLVERSMQAEYARHAETARDALDALSVDDESMIAQYAALLAQYRFDGPTPGIVYLDMENSESEQVFYAVLDSMTAGTLLESGEIASEFED